MKRTKEEPINELRTKNKTGLKKKKATDIDNIPPQPEILPQPPQNEILPQPPQPQQPQPQPRQRRQRQPRQPRQIIYENDDDDFDPFNKVKLSNVKRNTFRTVKPDFKYPIDNNLFNITKNYNIERDVKLMNPKPIVFALANPTPEIFPDEAYEAGAYIVATGRSDFPNQINNSVVFPGLFRATIDTRAPKITMEMKVAAGEAIANLVSPKELRPDYIMPSALNITTSVMVATDVAKLVIEKKLTKKKCINLDKLRENEAQT
jgi:hypothetical protein